MVHRCLPIPQKRRRSRSPRFFICLYHGTGLNQSNNYQNHKTMKNLILLLLVCAMSFGVESCGGNGKSDKERIAQLRDSVTQLKSSIASLQTRLQQAESSAGNTINASSASSTPSHSNVSANPWGTYKVVDKKGKTFYFTLNEDKTATVKREGSKKIYYCSLTDFRFADSGIWVDFSKDEPAIHFEGGVTDFYDNAGQVVLKDGWLYSSTEKADSKHPKWKLKAEKIK